MKLISSFLVGLFLSGYRFKSIKLTKKFFRWNKVLLFWTYYNHTYYNIFLMLDNR